MKIHFNDAEIKFRDEVQDFLETHLTEQIREGSRATPSVFVEPDIAMHWQRILYEKGWLVYHWPETYGGTGWSPVQKYIFEKECALADAPALPVLGLKLLGPVICEFGSDEQR